MAEPRVAHVEIEIIDCDAHWTEPTDLWAQQVPASWQDRVPIQRTVDGITGWYLNGDLWASTGGNTIARNRTKIIGSHAIQPFEEIDPSAWDVTERVAVLDDLGIRAQILYPNGIGFASNHLFAIDDPAQREVVLNSYNDHLVAVQKESGDRLLPQAVLPIWDMELTVKEMSRLIDAGIRGFTLSDKPELLGLPELPDRYFDPMWDLFNQSGTVASFHIGAGARREEMEALRRSTTVGLDADGDQPRTLAAASPTWSSFGPQRKMAVHAAQMYMSNVRIIVNLCNSNLFDRFPKLEIVSAESGIGWVPFILEAMEYQYDEMITRPEEVGLTARRPREYFADHIHVMFWFEEVGVERLVDKIGVRNILVETDLPHPTCLYPNPKERFDRVLANLDEETRRRILHDNAAELYRLPA